MMAGMLVDLSTQWPRPDDGNIFLPGCLLHCAVLHCIKTVFPFVYNM